jgi:four helix bundle protein
LAAESNEKENEKEKENEQENEQARARPAACHFACRKTLVKLAALALLSGSSSFGIVSASRLRLSFEEAETMPNETTFYLTHEKLIAYQVACDLLVAVVQARIRDPELRSQALRAAKSACLNIAEANGRASPADRRRVFAIARGEATEAAAAVHIAGLAGDCAPEHAERARKLGGRTVALLTGLLR